MAASSFVADVSQQQLVARPDFELLERIGSGSFGVVHRAKVQGHICAVKFIQQQIYEQIQGKALERFKQECLIMNSVRHDNIVQCLGNHYLEQLILIMELMDCNLREFLKSSPRYYIQVDIVMNILQAISYLHKRGIIHRDLSSANILMKGNIAKVTDFGMARLLDMSNINPFDLTGCPGTKHYMPPEALSDPPDYNHKIDVFSVGVLIVQILTGKMPNPSNQVLVLCPDFKNVRKCESEIERRADHIAECDDVNPLKMLAISCLQDNKANRPSADQLCAEVLKIQQSQLYLEDRHIGAQGMQLAMQYNVPQMLNSQSEKIKEGEHVVSILHSQVTELNQARHHDQLANLQLASRVTALQQSVKVKDGQIQDLQSRMTDLEVQAQKYSENIRQEVHENIRQEVHEYVQKMRSESDGEIKQLHHQLEVEKSHAVETVTAYQAKINELEQSSISSCSFNLQDSRSDSQLSQRQSSLVFEVTESSHKMHRWSSAVTHNQAIYVTPGRTNCIYKYFDNSWARYAKCQAKNSTLTFVNGRLVTIGGQLYSENKIVYSNFLYTTDDGKTWTDKYLPPMQVERDSVIAVANGKALIVAGGCAKAAIAGGRKYPVSINPLRVVEVLYLETGKWRYVSELPFPLYHASVTICGDKVFILGGTGPKARSKLPSSPGSHSVLKEGPGNEASSRSMLTCQLTNLVLSNSHGPSEWSEISKVPYSNSTCVTFKGNLLAVGGLKPDSSPSNEVLCYDEESDCWNNLGYLGVAREHCFTAVLSNKLFVIGGKSGSSLLSSVEIGTFTG